MASDVMTNEEFRAHMKRMVTWMQNTEQLMDYCPCCGQVLNRKETEDWSDANDQKICGDRDP